MKSYLLYTFYALDILQDKPGYITFQLTKFDFQIFLVGFTLNKIQNLTSNIINFPYLNQYTDLLSMYCIVDTLTFFHFIYSNYNYILITDSCMCSVALNMSFHFTKYENHT